MLQADREMVKILISKYLEKLLTTLSKILKDKFKLPKQPIQ